MVHRTEIIKLLDQLPQEELEKIQEYLQMKLALSKPKIHILSHLDKILSEDGEVLAELAK